MKILRCFTLLFLLITICSCSEDSQSAGCTDPLSSNYNSTVTEDDGSCNYLYGGREFGQLDIASRVDLNNEYDIYFNNAFVGRSTVYFPNGVSCGNPETIGQIMDSGNILVKAVGINGTDTREGFVNLGPQECKVFYIEDLPQVDDVGVGNGTGSAIFWINDDYGCGFITVNLSGAGLSTISSYFGAAPSCSTNGGAIFSNLSPGTYSFTASCSGTNWSGSINVSANNCTTQLLLPDNNNNGGGNDECDWTRGVNLLSVTTEVGVRCGSPTSYQMIVTNTSNIRLRTFICIRRLDGTYSGYGDGGNGLDPGESFSGFVCEGNGEYILYSEYWDIYEANGFCNYGGCP